MGKGNGFEMNMDMIFRIIELILLIVGIALFLIYNSDNAEALIFQHTLSGQMGSDAMCMSGSLFIILLLILLGMKLIKGEEVDAEFVGWLAVIGAVLLIITGICVCIDFKDGPNVMIISGIMAIIAGIALIVEALKDLGVF